MIQVYTAPSELLNYIKFQFMIPSHQLMIVDKYKNHI